MVLPKFNRAVLDKLKIVFHPHFFTLSEQQALLTELELLCADGKATKLSAQAKGFRHRYRIPLYEKEALFVETGANRPDVARWSTTLEFNPAKIGAIGRKALRSLIKRLLGSDFRHQMMNAFIYELHIAIDFEQRMRDLAIECRGKTTFGAWGKEFDGKSRLQTQTFGSKDSGHQGTAYDKRDQVLASIAMLSNCDFAKLKAVAGTMPERLRIEDRQRLKRAPIPLHRLGDLREPFSGFHIFSYASAEARLKSALEVQTLRLAQVIGLSAALQSLDKGTREAIRQKLSRCAVEWWDAAVHKDAIKAAMAKLKLFPDDAFDATRAGTHAEAIYQQMKEQDRNRNARQPKAKKRAK